MNNPPQFTSVTAVGLDVTISSRGFSWLLQCRRFVAGTDQQVAKFSKLDFVAGVEDFCVSELDGDIGVGVLIRAQSRCKGFTTSLGSAVLGQRFRQREPHLKTCVAGFRGDLNISPVFLHDSLNSVEAEPCAFPDSLRGEEWFENVRLYFGQDTRTVVVEIADNGPGILSEIKPHIFEPFFTTKGVGEGTGLGLDTVQRIVKKHRGNIQVTSKPGDTRFQVRLPLAEPLT